MAVDDDDPETKPDVDELSAADAADMRLQDVADEKADARAWVHTCLAVVAARSAKPDASGRVQLALDKTVIAACERIVRQLGADLADDMG